MENKQDLPPQKTYRNFRLLKPWNKTLEVSDSMVIWLVADVFIDAIYN